MELLSGIEIHKTYHAAKVVVVREVDGHFLILERSLDDERRPGESDFPGGEVEEGETYETAARREVRQEAGLDLGGVVLNPLCEVTKIENRGELTVAVTQMLFHAMVTEHELVIGDEHSGGAWYPPAEAAALLSSQPTKLMAFSLVQQQLSEDSLQLAS